MAKLKREKHGHAFVGKVTSEYTIWFNMKQRCGNPKHKQFAEYGGRGIKVCEKWKSSFRAFLRDVGPRPSKMHSLDRIDNNGHYEPGNVRWATAKQQNRNKRTNRWFTYCGRTFCVADWERIFYLPPATISKNLHRGKTFSQSITQIMKSFHGGRSADEFLETLCSTVD